jgi:hypothetical protein
VFSPVAQNDDCVPRLFGSAAAYYEFHGYCEGAEYAGLHIQATRKPVLAVGLPIATAGVISREDTSGNTGTSVSTVAAGGDGVLGEHDGVLDVETGGTIGTDQIVLGLSLNGGRTRKTVRLSTGSSYTIPFVNVTVSFGAGTLVAGDTIHTWHGSAPLANSAGFQLARENLAAQQKLFRSVVNCGDMPTDTLASALLTQINAYETENDRFVYARASVYDREPQAAMSRITARMTGAPTLTFAEVGATGDTITRSAGSWITDGFVVGDWIIVAGSASNNVAGVIASLSATVITLDTTDLVAEGPVADCTVTGSPALTFAEVGATGDTITRSRGSWLTDGFRVGDTVTVTGTASNNVSGAVTAVTATVLTFNTTDLAAEVLGSAAVTVTAGQTKAAWMAEADAEFSSIDDEPRIDLSAGRGLAPESPLSGWRFRRPAAWAASIREYAHDLHTTTWRKSDGILSGWTLDDEDGNLAEWDDRVDGSAGSAARFTTLRTWGNGPQGAFVALSLTRASDGDVLSYTHNAAVTNLACTTVQAATENSLVGRTPEINDDGTATSGEIATIEGEVNASLELALLQNAKGEGRRASKAVWSMDPETILNVAEATVTGVLDLNLNGTIHSVNTTVKVRSGGQ